MDIHEIRLKNLLDAIKAAGSQAKLAEMIGVKSSYISQIKNKNHKTNMGSDVARRIEQALNKPHGWMDKLHDDDAMPVGVKYGHLTVIEGGGQSDSTHKVHALDGDEEMLIRFLRMMTDEQRQETLESAKKIHDHNQAIVEKLTGKKRA